MSALGTRLSRRLPRHRLLALCNSRQADGEGRAHARLTFDRDVATHHPAKSLADREAKAGTAVFAAGGGLSLREFLEQLTHLLRRHPYAGVGDGNSNPVAAILLHLARVNRDGTALRKFVGVAHEVQQRLPQSHLVAIERADRRGTIDRDLVGILRCEGFDRLGYASDQGRERKGFELELHPPGLDLREVEDVIDQNQKMTAGAEHTIEWLRVLV